MPKYITPTKKCPHTQLHFRINHLIDKHNQTHYFIHYFNPHTSEFLFSWEI